MEISTVVLERKSTYIDHDRLFKELIQTFFKEFIEAFFPEEYAFINFSSVKFLEQEVFTDILKGEKRRIDILAEVNLKDEENIILFILNHSLITNKNFMSVCLFTAPASTKNTASLFYQSPFLAIMTKKEFLNNLRCNFPPYLY